MHEMEKVAVLQLAITGSELLLWSMLVGWSVGLSLGSRFTVQISCFPSESSVSCFWLPLFSVSSSWITQIYLLLWLWFLSSGKPTHQRGSLSVSSYSNCGHNLTSLVSLNPLSSLLVDPSPGHSQDSPLHSSEEVQPCCPFELHRELKTAIAVQILSVLESWCPIKTTWFLLDIKTGRRTNKHLDPWSPHHAG